MDGSTDGNCQDQNGHGSFVAGVVGAVGNNNVGVTGVNQVASIVTCRFMDATGNGWVSDAIRCFDYCMTFDTQVLSNSWGGVAYSDSLQVNLLRCTAGHLSAIDTTHTLLSCADSHQSGFIPGSAGRVLGRQ